VLRNSRSPWHRYCGFALSPLPEHLHGVIVERLLRHPSAAELDRHVASAVAKPTPGDWRLVKSAEAAQIDAVIALTMAAERATEPVAPVRLHGWL
jgi:hypothetical protein